MGNRNRETDQDRVESMVKMFNDSGIVMFRQQVAIYNHIRNRIKGRTVLEAGCGNGVGTAVLNLSAKSIVGTDKLRRNVYFARCLYPWIEFETWDINHTKNLIADTVVCIETIEHVNNPQEAIQNLLDSANEDVWISTPNGLGKPRPPENPHHVCEYTVEEMLGICLITRNTRVEIYDWEDFRIQNTHTRADPLTYHIIK